MYDSKRRVRNGWQAFTPALAQQQQQRLQLETHLRRAVDNHEFHLVYQPQVDLAQRPHRRRRGADPLAQPARWARCARTISSATPKPPATSSASAAGCCAKPAGRCGAWRDAGPGDRARRGQRVVPPVPRRGPRRHRRAALRESDLPGEALELEFTERVLIEDAPDTFATFAALRAAGRDAHASTISAKATARSTTCAGCRSTASS